MKHTILICLSFCLFVVSCKKNDTKSEPTKTEIITQASWKYDNAGIDADRNGSIDFPPPSGILLPCVIDNTLTLSSNGTGLVDEGSTKCATTDLQSVPITWSFADNETALKIGGGSLLGVSGQFKILELSTTKLSLSKDTTVPILGTVALIAILKH
ncbi:MAG TPA: hypothetical protein VM888_02595 [Chitinophagaceae bacterium]|jgi:hypothetical protein|nr:hypothetical protein [Chitinophagaceae bacterium]